jgi:multisubunit Na+/H+ antiporter MnhB subunit
MTPSAFDGKGSGRLPLRSWLWRSWAVIGLVIAVIATWRPGMVAQGAGHRLELQLPGWILAILAAAAVAVCLAILSSLIRPPRRKDPDEFELEPPPPPRLSPVAMALLLLLLVAFVASAVMVLHVTDRLRSGGAGFRPSGISAVHRPPIQPPTEPNPVNASAIDWGLTLALGAVAVLIISGALLIIGGNEPWWVLAQWLRVRRRRRTALVRDLASAISAGVRDLEAGDDPRLAVIACYRRCETAIASHRRKRYAAETPREFVADALAALQLPVEAIGSLLRVFERARFSNLPITSDDRDIAAAALGAVRSALEQRAQDGSES